VHDVILVAENGEAARCSRLETDLVSQITSHFSFLGVTLAKCFCLRIWRCKLSCFLLGDRSDYLLMRCLLVNFQQLGSLD
jgi:hypothetical protein